MPRADRLMPLGILAAAALCACVALSPAPAAAKAACAFPLALWLPGMALMRAAFPGRPASAETRVLSVALSMALTVLCGLALHLLGHLNPEGWALGLALVTCVAAALASRIQAPPLLRPAPSPVEGPVPANANRPASALRPLDALLLLLAALVAAASVAHARTGALSHSEYRYTEFWMVPSNPGSTYATLGLRNAEKVPASYQVDVLDDGKLVSRWPAIRLEPGDTRTSHVTAVPRPQARRVEAWLYKDGNRDVVYRKVWMEVPADARASTAAQTEKD